MDNFFLTRPPHEAVIRRKSILLLIYNILFLLFYFVVKINVLTLQCVSGLQNMFESLNSGD